MMKLNENRLVIFAFAGILVCTLNGVMQGSRHSSEYRIVSDSSLGKLIKTVSSNGQFIQFDKDHADRCFLKDAYGMSLNGLMGVKEMDCFLANHVKDELAFTYEIHEASAEAKGRVNYLLRIVALKSGDDTRTWEKKESLDSAQRARHHEQLEKVRKGRG